jgi:hypothetical protein
MANKVFAANPIAAEDNRVRIMVMFTDGVPGQYDFDTDAANRAIALSYETKNEYNAYSYTIGLYQSDGVTGTSEESIFMHAVSSNYKEAKKMDDDELVDAIVNINDDIDSDMALERYIPVMRALIFLGRDAAYKYLKSFIDEEELEDYGIED